MNKYVLMLAAGALIAAAPAYYAIQAHADEANAPLSETTTIAPTAEDEAAADGADIQEAAPEAATADTDAETPAVEGDAPATEGTAQ